MKKTIALIIAVLMILPVLPVYGGEDDVVMMIVSCPEQNFATVCRPDYSYDYTPDGGLTIYFGDSEDAGRSVGKITIFKTDAPGSNFEAETYFNNAYLNLLESSYGDNLLDPGEYTVYSFAGREMPGRMALYLDNGRGRMRFCLYDLQEDYFVRYEAFSSFEETEMQSTIDDLSSAIRYFQPDAQYYYGGNTESEKNDNPVKDQSTNTTPEPENTTSQPDLSQIDEAEAGPMFQVISYPKQGFSTKCRVADTVEYKPYGATAFLQAEDITIWVRICRLGADPDFDAETYFQEEVTPEMSNIYEDYSYREEEFTSYSIYGREMWGKEYGYSIRGNDYTRRILIYQSEDDIVRYEAVYTEDSYDRVMKELSLVVEYYRPDPYCYLNGEPQKEKTDQDTGIGNDQLVIDTGDTGMGKDGLVIGTKDTGTGKDGQVIGTDDSNLQAIDCPELGFSVKADPAYGWDYQENTGISIYTKSEGSIPYVIVFQSEDLLMEPFDYIKEQYTPHIEQQYGDDLIGVVEYEVYEIGGKELPAGLYIYDLNGHTIEMLRIMDSTGAHTVIYTAKYEQGEGDVTLEALDTAVRTFKSY